MIACHGKIHYAGPGFYSMDDNGVYRHGEFPTYSRIRVKAQFVVKDGELRVPVFATDFRVAYSFDLFSLPFYVYLNLKNLTNYNYIELIGNIRPIRNYSLGLKFIF